MKQPATPTPLNSTIPFPAPRLSAHEQGVPNSASASHEKPRRGRPTLCSPQVLSMMKDVILRNGFSDTAAAESVGMSSTTISRWKKKDPEIAAELQKTRQGCRLYHFEKILQHAESETMRGLRASMWILERLFPGDYSPKMSERFEYRTLEDQRKEREDRDLVYDDVKLRKEADRAAAEEARQTQAAEAAGSPKEHEASGNHVAASEDNSRNVRNAADAESETNASGTPVETSGAHGEGDSRKARNAEDAGSEVKESGAPVETAGAHSDGDSRKFRNAGDGESEARKSGKPEETPVEHSESDSRISRKAREDGSGQGRPDWSPLLGAVTEIPGMHRRDPAARLAQAAGLPGF